MSSLTDGMIVAEMLRPASAYALGVLARCVDKRLVAGPTGLGPALPPGLAEKMCAASPLDTLPPAALGPSVGRRQTGNEQW